MHSSPNSRCVIIDVVVDIDLDLVVEIDVDLVICYCRLD